MAGFNLSRVTEVGHVRDHVLWLRFSDGFQGEVDLSHALRGPVFEPLRDPAFFARVRVEGPSITWPNDVDWDPDDLHDRLEALEGHGSQYTGAGTRRA